MFCLVCDQGPVLPCSVCVTGAQFSHVLPRWIRVRFSSHPTCRLGSGSQILACVNQGSGSPQVLCGSGPGSPQILSVWIRTQFSSCSFCVDQIWFSSGSVCVGQDPILPVDSVCVDQIWFLLVLSVWIRPSSPHVLSVGIRIRSPQVLSVWI